MTTFAYPLTALVVVIAVAVIFWTGILVARARARCDVPAPRMDGPEPFMLAMRVQANTVEQAVLYFPLLFVFAGLAGDGQAAAVGIVWPIGRIIYAIGYTTAANKRSIGFLVTFLSTVVMLVGSLWLAVRALLG